MEQAFFFQGAAMDPDAFSKMAQKKQPFIFGCFFQVSKEQRIS